MTTKKEQQITILNLDENGVGVCRFLVADNQICGIRLVPHVRANGITDYYYCPKCNDELKSQGERLK